jgi:peptide/nickel transport system permease protein
MRRTHAWIWVCCRSIVLVLIAGIAGASLVQFAPGFGIDERALDPRLSTESRRVLEKEHAQERNPLTFYVRFLKGVFRGDLGRSATSGEPVAELIRRRAGVTVRAVALGLAAAWIFAFTIAAATALSRNPGVAVLSTAAGGLLLSVPSAILAILCLLLHLAPWVAIAAVAYPRLFPYILEQLRSSIARPHVILARARGVHPASVFLLHVLPTIAPLVALAGISVALGFGASIPIEALADSPGLGQLAWNAALARDLPVLVSITLLLTAVTVAANTAADLLLIRLGGATR